MSPADLEGDDTMDKLTTQWRLTQIADVRRLNVILTVDTTAPGVVAAIEDAAARAGVVLERATEAMPEGRDRRSPNMGADTTPDASDVGSPDVP